MIPFGTHRIRVYRSGLSIKHDLHSVLVQEDIYGEDKLAIFRESDAEYIAGTGDMGLTRRPAQLIVPIDVDLDEGYYVEVKKPMRLNGAWVAVETTASTALSAGDTDIPVARTTGFGPGDELLVKDTTCSEMLRLKSVGDSTLTVYDDLALENDYDEGATVRATRFFRVMNVRWPHDLAPQRVADLVECSRKESS